MITTPTAAARVSGTITLTAYAPYRLCPHTLKIWGTSKDGEQQYHIADTRGWGALIGGGAQGLDEKTAFEIQKATGQFIVDALNEKAAAIQPDPEPQPVAWVHRWPDGKFQCYSGTADTEFPEMISTPLYATPSSAGTVSVEAAARPMSDIPEDGTWALLYPGYYGPVTACAMNGEWSLFNDAEKPHVTHWVEIQPALRALAGEGGR